MNSFLPQVRHTVVFLEIIRFWSLHVKYIHETNQHFCFLCFHSRWGFQFSCFLVPQSPLEIIFNSRGKYFRVTNYERKFRWTSLFLRIFSCGAQRAIPSGQDTSSLPARGILPARVASHSTGSTQSCWIGREYIKERNEWTVYLCLFLSSLLSYAIFTGETAAYKSCVTAWSAILVPRPFRAGQKFFLICIKFDKGGNSVPKHFERTANIHSNLEISLLSWNQTNTKMRSESFSITWPNLFSNTFATVGEF